MRTSDSGWKRVTTQTSVRVRNGSVSADKAQLRSERSLPSPVVTHSSPCAVPTMSPTKAAASSTCSPAAIARPLGPIGGDATSTKAPEGDSREDPKERPETSRCCAARTSAPPGRVAPPRQSRSHPARARSTPHPPVRAAGRAGARRRGGLTADEDKCGGGQHGVAQRVRSAVYRLPSTVYRLPCAAGSRLRALHRVRVHRLDDHSWLRPIFQPLHARAAPDFPACSVHPHAAKRDGTNNGPHHTTLSAGGAPTRRACATRAYRWPRRIAQRMARHA